MAKRKHTHPARVRLDSGHHRRIRQMAVVLGLLAFVPVIFRLYSLMIVNYDYYADLALRNQSRTTQVAPARGEIYDRNGNLLAGNENVETLYLNPNELKQSGADIDGLCQWLGELLGKDPDWIREKARNLTQRYQQIATRLDSGTADQIRAYIREQEISGVHLEPATKRVYPYGSLAAQVIGFTNLSGEGCEGVEAAYDSYLSGKSGKVVTTKGNNEMDMPFSYERYLAGQQGCSLVLTLDATVQACLETRMAEAVARYNVQNGAFGIVMNVKTGEILAMATLGSFDPNAYLEIGDENTAAELEQMRQDYLQYEEGSEDYEAGERAYQQALNGARLAQWRNRCIADGYEPGSTFKVLTMAAALDSGSITLENTYHCGGAQQIPGRAQLLHCWRSQGHGSQSTSQALQNSCNIAFANIALTMGGETFYAYMERFGVMEKTGIDLYGESKGVFFSRELITDTDKWGTASLTSGSFGQTFKVTPLQLVRAIASVVNGGYLMEPYIVSQIVDAEGNVVMQAQPTVVRRTISEETSAVMRQMITSVVTEGTAKNAQVAGFSVGGKTGTSEKIDVLDENGQPTLDKIVSFVGIAPMEDPEYIVLIALDTPSRDTGIYISGGVMAAPTVGAVLGDILTYLGVEKTPNADAQTVVLEDLTDFSAEDAQKYLASQDLTATIKGGGERVTAQIPGPGETVTAGDSVLLYFGEDPQPVAVPDFAGMNRQQAFDAAGLLGLRINAAGNDTLSPQVLVTAQDIPPGTQVEAGTAVTLTFTDMQAPE